MTKIIAPLDGSREAERALPHARMLAGSDHLILMSSTWRGEPIAPRRYLEERATQVVGPPVETRVLLDQPPEEAIAQVARDEAPALVCMASHGRSTIGELVLGSTAEAVTRTMSEPVLLVGPHAIHDAERAAAANLVVAVDGAATAAAIVPTAAKFAARHGLRLWTVESTPPAPFPFVADADAPTELASGPGLAAAIDILLPMHVATETKLLTALDPADAIVSFAQELPASFVVVGSHARTGLTRIALGNTAMRVVHRSPCPVLVVKQ